MFDPVLFNFFGKTGCVCDPLGAAKVFVFFWNATGEGQADGEVVGDELTAITRGAAGLDPDNPSPSVLDFPNKVGPRGCEDEVVRKDDGFSPPLREQ